MAVSRRVSPRTVKQAASSDFVDEGKGNGRTNSFLLLMLLTSLSAIAYLSFFFLRTTGSVLCPSHSEDSSALLLRNEKDKQPPPKFVLYRLIGNNMPPLQCHGQLLKNTRFALEHELPLPGCKKRWVLNNIVNGTERALLLDLLLSHGYTLEDIIVRRINYTRVASFPRDTWTSVVTAQNEARNEIIRQGRASGARWILAFDGNQFYTREAWEAIVRAAERWEKAGLKYFKVPMYRLYSKQRSSWLNGSTPFRAVRKYAPVLWESQLAFRNDSDQLYVEGMVYGKDNKLELIDRVCGTGRFNETEQQEGILDTGLCGCHKEVGNDRRQREVNEEVALYCGYSVRLWYHPCAEVDPARIFKDRKYRARLRDKGYKKLTRTIVKNIEALKHL
eukprot:jgi/Mesen1/3117/ME000184S02177